ADGIAFLTIGDAQIDVQRGAAAGFRRRFDFKEFVLEQFRAADVKGRGYLERSDLRDLNQAAFLRLLLPLVDRDGDERMTEEELVAFFDLQAGALSGYVALGVFDKGRDLFTFLDANRDGLLGVRELRTAWPRLAALDRKGQGFVRADDLPRQFQLIVNR